MVSPLNAMSPLKSAMSPLIGANPLKSTTSPLITVNPLPISVTHSVPVTKSNLLRPQSEAMWAHNDLDELQHEMSNQLQHLVTHSMSLDMNKLSSLARISGRDRVVDTDSDHTDSDLEYTAAKTTNTARHKIGNSHSYSQSADMSRQVMRLR